MSKKYTKNSNIKNCSKYNDYRDDINLKNEEEDYFLDYIEQKNKNRNKRERNLKQKRNKFSNDDWD